MTTVLTGIFLTVTGSIRKVSLVRLSLIDSGESSYDHGRRLKAQLARQNLYSCIIRKAAKRFSTVKRTANSN